MKSLLASLAFAAVLVPGASAASEPPTHQATRTTVVVVREPRSGFDWPAALIGAGAASGLALARAAGVLIGCRRDEFGSSTDARQ